jgi:hypothetical protein
LRESSGQTETRENEEITEVGDGGVFNEGGADVVERLVLVRDKGSVSNWPVICGIEERPNEPVSVRIATEGEEVVVAGSLDVLLALYGFVRLGSSLASFVETTSPSIHPSSLVSPFISRSILFSSISSISSNALTRRNVVDRRAFSFSPVIPLPILLLCFLPARFPHNYPYILLDLHLVGPTAC